MLRSVRYLFQKMLKSSSKTVDFYINASFIEIYNEQIVDLLSDRKKQSLNFRYNKKDVESNSRASLYPIWKSSIARDKKKCSTWSAAASPAKKWADTKWTKTLRAHTQFSQFISSSRPVTGRRPAARATSARNSGRSRSWIWRAVSASSWPGRVGTCCGKRRRSINRCLIWGRWFRCCRRIWTRSEAD